MSVSLSFILHIYRGLNATTSQPSNLPSKISSNPFHHLPNHIFQNALKFSPRCGLKFPKKKVLTFLLRGLFPWEPLPIHKNFLFACLLVNLTKRPPKLNPTPFHVKAQSGIFQKPSFSHANQIWYSTILKIASLV